MSLLRLQNGFYPIVLWYLRRAYPAVYPDTNLGTAQAKLTAGVSYIVRSTSKQINVEGAMPPLPHTVIRPPIEPSDPDLEAVQKLINTVTQEVRKSPFNSLISL